MALSFSKLKSFATGPQGKKLIAQARKLDTPQNRKKAKDAVAKLRERAAPAVKAAKARSKPQGGGQSPPA